jgi:hypothetical protein
MPCAPSSVCSAGDLRVLQGARVGDHAGGTSVCPSDACAIQVLSGEQVVTGRPGCAAHTSTWNAAKGPICYVQHDCLVAKRAFEWPSIKWRECQPVGICPAACQAALDSLMATPSIQDCLVDTAQRQGLCPGLDLISHFVDRGVGPGGLSTLNGEYFTSIAYLRLWAAANGCQVASEFDTGGLWIFGHFISLAILIAWCTAPHPAPPIVCPGG